MMEPTASSRSPRILYDHRYIEPEIALLTLEPVDRLGAGVVSRVRRFRPTGIRTPGGLYEYEQVDDRPLVERR